MFKQLLKKIHDPIYTRRIEVLTELIVAQLRAGDSVLDVGCGSGQLGTALAAQEHCPEGVMVQGCEKNPRGNEGIPVVAFDGYRIPADDDAHDVSILADVVHHEPDPERLLKEVIRVTRRTLIIKDHTPNGFLGYPRVCFMDWAANNPYGVKCLFRYFSAAEWRELYKANQLDLAAEHETIDLYPSIWNQVFGKRLQYFAVLAKGRES